MNVKRDTFGILKLLMVNSPIVKDVTHVCLAVQNVLTHTIVKTVQLAKFLLSKEMDVKNQSNIAKAVQ